ncbi:MAG: hypothetical protein ACKVH8_04425 [Pirellulales bacterium]
MGALLFCVPGPEHLPARSLDYAQILGYGRMQTHCSTQLKDGLLKVEFDSTDSSKLQIPWRIDQERSYLLTTCSLPISEKPYHLSLEIARGTLSRLKNVLEICRASKIVVSDEVMQEHAESIKHFTIAATTDHDSPESSESACNSLDAAVRAFTHLAVIYQDASLDFVKKQAPKRIFLFGCQLRDQVPSADTTSTLKQLYNTAMIAPVWKDCEAETGHINLDHIEQQIQWCRSNSMRVILGPIANLDSLNVPDWFYLWEQDFTNILSFLQKYIEAVVNRFANHVDLWYCASGINTANALALTEQQQLHVLVASIELLRSYDRKSPVLVSFDQPWGDYLRNTTRDLSPIHFAEEIIRANLGVSGIGLELNFSDCDGATFPRDPFEITELLDQWGSLGLPLFVTLTVPSSKRNDPHSELQLPEEEDLLFKINRRFQRTFTEQIVPTLATHPSVQGLFWNHLTDATNHQFPNGGLFDRSDKPKSTLRSLAEIRSRYLT